MCSDPPPHTCTCLCTTKKTSKAILINLCINLLTSYDKGKFFTVLHKVPCHKTHGVSEGRAPQIRSLSEWSVSRPDCCILQTRSAAQNARWYSKPPMNTWIGDKPFTSVMSRTHILQSSSPLPSHDTDWAIPTPIIYFLISWFMQSFVGSFSYFFYSLSRKVAFSMV